MATAEISETIHIFEEAGRHMSKERFCDVMSKLYGESVEEEELVSIYRSVKASWRNTGHPAELRDYLLNKFTAAQKMKKKNLLFPKPFQVIPVGGSRPIVGLFFRPSGALQSPEGHEVPEGQLRAYQTGLYLSATSSGQLKTWSDTFEQKSNVDLGKIGSLYSECEDICVNDLVLLEELQQMAVCTKRKELIFYDCSQSFDSFTLRHVFMAEKHSINTLSYWSDGTKAIFSFGDEGGCLTLLISYDVKKNDLFCSDTCVSAAPQDYPLVSTLFTKNSSRYLALDVPVFFDACGQVQYCPSIHTFAVCGASSMKMGVVALPPSGASSPVKMVLESEGLLGFFGCAAYSPSTKRLLTGGKDGSIRVWRPEERTPERTLAGHFKPVTHVRSHPHEGIFVSSSEDMSVRVWSEKTWLCLQRLKVKDLGPDRVSCVCYNLNNNELVLATANIAKCWGKGTDLFKESLTSHEAPIQVLRYHGLLKLVISACLDGLVTVWDIETGKSVIEFNACVDCMKLTALSIDGSHRRLITATEDGKLRVWNLSSGTELFVLPVTVPGTVSAIVCKNNRVFVSQKKSKAIYNLGINGHENRYLEHEYLTDIVSMDVHKKNLVAASSNGNVLVWDVLTSVALFWFSPTTRPQMCTLSKADQGHTGFLPVAKGGSNRRAAHKTAWTRTAGNNGPLINILKTREASDETATVLTATGGYVYAWSVVREGGLLGRFVALKDKGGVITAMSTDVDERTLMTGDDAGRVYLWDVTSFGLKVDNDGPSEEVGGWRVPVFTRVLLASWTGHRSDVLDLSSDAAGSYVVSAGLDQNVKLWTRTGRLLGLFGQGEWGTGVKPYQLQVSRAQDSASHSSSITSTGDTSPKEACEESVPEPEAKPTSGSAGPSPSQRELLTLCGVLLPYRPVTSQLARKKKQAKQKALWKLYSLSLSRGAPEPGQQEDTTAPPQRSVKTCKKLPAGTKPGHEPVFHTTVRAHRKGFENAEEAPSGILNRHLESRNELLKYSWPTRVYHRRHSDSLLSVRKRDRQRGRSLSQSPRRRDSPWSGQRVSAGPKYTMTDINRMLTSICEELEPHWDTDSDTSGSPESLDLDQTDSETESVCLEAEEVEDTTVQVEDTPKTTKAKRRRRRVPPPPGEAPPRESDSRSMRGLLLKLDQVEKTSGRTAAPQASGLAVPEPTQVYSMSDVEAFLVMYHSWSHQA